MSPEPEKNSRSALTRNLGLPWYALRPYGDPDRNTFITRVKPLDSQQIGQSINSLTRGDDDRMELAQLLRDENQQLLRSSGAVALILDGRAPLQTEGYLGDMIEASRLANAVRAGGKGLIIATAHPDLFLGVNNPEVEVIPIPDDVTAAHTPPWKPQLLSYLHDSIGDTPCIFPMNASTPVLMQLGAGGKIRNLDTLGYSKEAFRPTAANYHIIPTIWGKLGLHQLQAFQITAHLLGFEEPQRWEQFPDAFLYPSQEAQEVAKEVVRIYGCFDRLQGRFDCPPMYLHPGVATNGSKLTTKFYPEEKWTRVIQLLSAAPNIAASMTFLEPTDREQGAMTLRLATAAVEAGLHVAKVPMAQVKQRYPWTLGSFISFLQELSKHRGMIVGCDSMPAGHASSATGNPAVVLGSYCYNPAFYSPSEKALVVLPVSSSYTSAIEPEPVVSAVQALCLDRSLEYSTVDR